MQVRRETLKSAHRLWIAIRSYGDVMHAVAYIDPRCMRMNYRQSRVLRLQPPGAHSFLSFRFRHSFLSVIIPAPQ
jgi:hypothetical protein